ncbi:MAG: retropepsin-like aspartic protease [Cyanobacteria bacterium P01_G01_bin.19]
MKKLVQLLFLAAVFNVIAIAVEAQESSTCFMLDAEGNSINLGSLCQGSQSSGSSYYPSPTPTYPQQNYNYQPPQTYSTERGVYVIPIKSRVSGVPVIDVTFNDKHTFEMLLDTGASGIYITQHMASKLNINYTRTELISTASDRISVPSGLVYSVGVGEIIQKNTRVSTLPTMDMGLLGQSFFGNFDMTIKSDTIEFRER